MRLPRLVLAAPMSGSGKTTVAAGLTAALAARGLRVAPFKVGPDYIDPSYHALAAGRPSRNLDSWMLTPDQVRAVFAHASADADVAIVEGVMGLYDGLSGTDDAGSTADAARLLEAPVLLVLDASAMARTAAAVVQGLRDFDSRIRLAGVLLNRVAGEGHAEMLVHAIESEVRVPVVGYLPRDDALVLPERHLGLIPTREPGRWNSWLDAARQRIAQTVNLDQIVELARSAPPLPPVVRDPFHIDPVSGGKIAVARDEAFSFIYEDNLDLLRAAGAEIAFFSPLRDEALPPEAQALYLCGGFPEMYAPQLAANLPMRQAVRAAALAGLPIYAECGGLMYLTEEIVDLAGASHPMTGVLPGRSAMSGQLTLGYRTARATKDSWLWRAGETIRGHEFHYSVWQDRPRELAPAYELLPEAGQSEYRADGAQIGNLIASYVHLHLVAKPELARRFIAAGSRTMTSTEEH